MTGSPHTMGHLLVRKLETFGILADGDRAALHDAGADVRDVPARKNLVLKGAPPQGVFVILKGFACRYQLLPGGGRQIIAYLLPGDFCDLDVMLLDRMDHSVGALSACSVAQLAPTMVHDLLQRPALGRALRLTTLAETANLRDWVVNIGKRPAVVRVAHLLCGLHARLEAVGLTVGNSFDFPLTQDDIADTMGMSTMHMNRSLQELRSAKLIEFQRSCVTIPSLPRLKTFAQFEATYPHSDARAAA